MKEKVTAVRYVLAGIIIGALMVGIFPVAAAVKEYICYKADYKLIIKGVEFTGSEDYPLLNYKGKSYLPVRDAFEAAGMTVNWNAELNQGEITESVAPAASETIEGGTSVSDTGTITQTPDGITDIDTWEGKQYIAPLYIRNKIQDKGYDLKNDPQTKKWILTKGNEVLIDDVPVTYLSGLGTGGVELDYYINTIIPLIK